MMDVRTRTEFGRVREALMVHFTESPASRHKDRVEVRGRGGFTLWADFSASDWTVRVEGSPSPDQIERLSRADDLLDGRLSQRLYEVDPDLASRVVTCEEKHHFVRGTGRVRRAYEE